MNAATTSEAKTLRERITDVCAGPGLRVRAEVIAKRYDVTERCVFQWASQGRIPVIKIGKTVRFDLDAVIEAIEGKGELAQ